jgi:quercetin dioxygenase-like cupin family protein
MTGSSTTARSDRPSILCDAPAEIAKSETATIGVLWRLSETGRQLDANLVQLAPWQHIDVHAEPDLDVLIVVMDGTGDLRAENLTMRLAAGLVAWLPRGSSRTLAAGARGLAYISVHRRRPGMQIGLKPPATAMMPPRGLMGAPSSAGSPSEPQFRRTATKSQHWPAGASLGSGSR